jgi:hypothetical protein
VLSKNVSLWQKLTEIRISCSSSLFFRSVTHIGPVYQFLWVKKNQILSQYPKGLASGFTKKYQFAVQTDRNSVFLYGKAQILDRLHIMVSYLSFYGV